MKYLRTIIKDTRASGKSTDDIEVLIKAIKKATARSGSEYTVLTVQDKTGETALKKFSSFVGDADAIQVGNVVRLTIEFSMFNGAPSGIVKDVIGALPEADLAKYRFTIVPDVDGMRAYLLGWLETLKKWSPDAEKVLNGTLLKDEKTINAFCIWPGAQGMHHDVQYGLLMHTTTVMKSCEKMCDVYNETIPGSVCKNLVMLAAALHDYGKLQDYGFDGKTEEITTNASLYYRPHYLEACYDIERIDALQGLDQTFKLRLQQAIQSHHGKLEFGALTAPVTPEDFILSACDALDAQMYRAVFHERELDPGEASDRLADGSRIVKIGENE
jgi:3'-5' exoribonuclease